LRDLVFFNVCAIASLRWIASAAHAGAGSLILWAIAALFFFLPSALVVARLSERFPEEGGMYVWAKKAFGDQHAFLCAWFYYISNILYFPSLLMAGITMAAYALGNAGPRLAADRSYALPLTLLFLWALFAANFFGLKVAKWVLMLGASSTFVLGALLGVFAVIASTRAGSASHFHFAIETKFGTLNFWSQIALAFTGLELAPIVSGEIRNPRRDVPRAAVISGIACALFYIGGTAALLVLLKPANISAMTGLAQAGAAAAGTLGLPALSVVFAVLISIAVSGQLGAYIAGNTRLPYAIGIDHYLPEAFARLHRRWGTPYISLLVQAVAATVCLIMAQWGETVGAAYQIMVDMMVIATLIPFVYIFGSGFRFANRPAAVSGLAVTLMAIVLSALPPAEAASALTFELKVVGGCIIFGALGWLVFKRYETKRLAHSEIPRAGSGSGRRHSRV
jgi:amino acid transporter